MHAAEQIVSNAAKEPSAEATAGLSDAASVLTKEGISDAISAMKVPKEILEEETIDGEEETGLDPG